MTKIMLALVSISMFLTCSLFAAEDPLIKGVEEALDAFAEGCQTELSTYCKDVTPGEGRILACLYAFSDKVSPRCEYALYDSMGQLNRTVANMSYTINECNDDLGALCREVKPGEGRLLDCLKKNESKVSSRCLSALKDVGWMN